MQLLGHMLPTRQRLQGIVGECIVGHEPKSNVEHHPCRQGRCRIGSTMRVEAQQRSSAPATGAGSLQRSFYAQSRHVSHLGVRECAEASEAAARPKHEKGGGAPRRRLHECDGLPGVPGRGRGVGGAVVEAVAGLELLHHFCTLARQHRRREAAPGGTQNGRSPVDEALR